MSVNTQYYPGLDILKYILSLFIVAAHTELFKEWPSIYNMNGHLIEIAIPVFFSVSSFLFYKKLLDTEKTQRVLLHTLKRLVLFYLIWYALMLPMTYERFFKVATMKEILYNATLSSTFNGYWFVKALIFNTVLLGFCKSAFKLILLSIVGLGLYLFFSFNYIYHFIHLSISPYYSFFYHIGYFCMGAWMARIFRPAFLGGVRLSKVLGLFLLMLFLLAMSFITDFEPVYRLLIPWIVIPMFLPLSCRYWGFVKSMRIMSIYYYMMQFMLIWIYNMVYPAFLVIDSPGYSFFDMSIIRFILIVLVMTTISFWLMRLENKCPYVKYLH